MPSRRRKSNIDKASISAPVQLLVAQRYEDLPFSSASTSAPLGSTTTKHNCIGQTHPTTHAPPVDAAVPSNLSNIYVREIASNDANAPANMATSTPRPSTSSTRPGALQRTHSRFQEGSMNDRVSAAPPPSFLGPEEDIERQLRQAKLYASDECARPAWQRPVSAGGAFASSSSRSVRAGSIADSIKRGGVGLLGSMWDGVKGAFVFGASKNGGKARPWSLDWKTNAGVVPPGSRSVGGLVTTSGSEDGDVAMADAGSADGNGKTLPSLSERPTRDEIMQNYNQLMASGFFSAHAIKSTRHAGPGAPMPPPQSSASARDFPASTYSPSSPHSGRRPTAFGLTPSLAPAAPPPSLQGRSEPDDPRTSHGHGHARQGAYHHRKTLSVDAVMSDLPTQRSQRGTKRSHADDASEVSESRAGSAVKKLRKSASRISVDLGLRKQPGEKEREQEAENNKEKEMEKEKKDKKNRYYPPITLPPGSTHKHGVITRRSFSNGNHAGTNKLAKVMRGNGGGSSSHGSGSGSGSSSGKMPGSFPGAEGMDRSLPIPSPTRASRSNQLHQKQPPLPLHPSLPFDLPNAGISRPGTPTVDRLSPHAVRRKPLPISPGTTAFVSAPAPSPNITIYSPDEDSTPTRRWDKASRSTNFTGTSSVNWSAVVPVREHQQNVASPRRSQDGRPSGLSVVPNANRGIPRVPEIPAQFKARKLAAMGGDAEEKRYSDEENRPPRAAVRNH